MERARVILACLEGKEIQQVARELGVSIPTVTKWRRRFSLWGLRGLRDQPRSGKPVKYDAAFRDRVLASVGATSSSRPVALGWAGGGGEARGPACTRSGASCVARASICDDCAVGA